MYLSMAVLSAGVAFVANALWPLLFVPVVLLAVQRLVIAREEGYLERKFGENYLAYKTRVRRWL
jgi:protein-S-isoprenylcysteine O-methyltransferase Ste14